MIRLVSRTLSAFATLGAVIAAVARKRHRRFLVLLPALLLVAVALAIVSSSGALAPFVYPLF